MKLLIIGGHFSPALAVIESLPKDTEVLYVGRKYALEGDTTLSLEYQTITARNIPFASLTTGRFQRKWTKYTLPSLLKLPAGFFQALKIIRTFKPAVILGFGGYVQIPICIVGFLLQIPIVIHEQTFEAGLANKIIASLATKVCISWKTSSTFFPRRKTVLTGNPALSPIFDEKKGLMPKQNTRPHLVIVGGSLGSHAINILVAACLEELSKHFTILHQTGDAKEFKDYDMLEVKREKLAPSVRENYSIVKFIDPSKIVSVFKSADLVISRAGVNTVTALLILQKVSLLLPLPVSQHNEQQKNALFLKKYGLGEVLDQNETTPEIFLSTIHDMIKNKEQYHMIMDKAELDIHKEAVKKIIEILSYVKKSPS